MLVPNIVFVLGSFHMEFISLAKALKSRGKVIIISGDTNYLSYCIKNDIQFEMLNATKKNSLNSYNFSFLRFMAGFIEHKGLKKYARSILESFNPDILVVSADHKGVFYHIINQATCPSILPQLTIYSETDLLLGYNKKKLSNLFPMRLLQKEIFKKHNGEWLQYMEPFSYSLGKYMGGYKQKFISKGGNVTVFALTGKAFKKLYLKIGVPSRKLQVVGNIEHDDIAHSRKKELEWQNSYNSKYRILFFLPPLFSGLPSEKAILEFKELLRDIIEFTNNNTFIGLKPHPLDVKKSQFDELRGLCLSNNIHLINTRGYASSFDIAKLVTEYDICIHSVSSVQFILQALNKAHFVYLSENSPYYSPEHKFFYNRYSFFAHDNASFMQILKRMYYEQDTVKAIMKNKSEEFTKAYMVLDGLALSRYEKIVDALLEQSLNLKSKLQEI